MQTFLTQTSWEVNLEQANLKVTKLNGENLQGANLQWAYLRDVNFRDTMCFSAATRQHSSNEKFPSEECGHLTAISIESVTNGDEQVCMQAVIINLRIMCDLLHNNVCIQVGHWSRTQLMLEPTQSLILKPL
jgi:hypothetical protein